MGRTFSIITTSMGRLEHLKLSVPNMLLHGCREVIVVDYSCPERSGDFVQRHFPSANVVRVEGEAYFSNWRARNAGAAVATSDVLVFCDADTLLAEDAIGWLDSHLPEKSFGFFDRSASARFNKAGLRLATNQLKGFHVVPTAAFRRVGGYDEVLEGYAAGGDTDLEERLTRLGLARFALSPSIIKSVIEHDNIDRRKRHRDSVPTSYGAGLLYRAAKSALLSIRRRLELPLETRRNLYSAARRAASALGPSQDSVSMTVAIGTHPILMPRQLGYEKGTQKVSIKVEVSLVNKLDAIPD